MIAIDTTPPASDIRALRDDEIEAVSGGKPAGGESWFTALAKALGEAANKQARNQ